MPQKPRFSLPNLFATISAMNFYSLVISLLFFLIGNALLFATPEPAAMASPGYHLVWADDFRHDPNGLPDPSKWIDEEGFIRNNEAQYYTRARRENARVENGQLIIEARKEEYKGFAQGRPATAHYTSAALETRTKAAWTFGRIEVRAKLPIGKGVWPAIWTLGTNEADPHVGWPKCGEIDIMELVGRIPGIVRGTIHYFVKGARASQGGPLTVAHPESAFHVYAAEWTPTRIDLFVDAKKFFSFEVKEADNDSQNPFRKPHFLLLNVALGGESGGPIDNSIFPQRMVVDYVRVYQESAP
jgi:beta-glucanase (GH16 family)